MNKEYFEQYLDTETCRDAYTKEGSKYRDPIVMKDAALYACESAQKDFKNKAIQLFKDKLEECDEQDGSSIIKYSEVIETLQGIEVGK